MSKLYRTSDLNFASYLCALDVEMTATEDEKNPRGERKVVFVFTVDGSKLKRMKELYFGGRGTVKIRRYVDAQRALKEMCHV